MIYVIAGTEAQAYEYINRKLEESISNGLNPVNIQEYKYVHSPDVFRGIRDPSGVFIGTWESRKDMEEIFQALLTSIDIKSQKHRIVNDIWSKWNDKRV